MSNLSDRLAAAKAEEEKAARYPAWKAANDNHAGLHVWDVSGSEEISTSIAEFMELAAAHQQSGGCIQLAPPNPLDSGYSRDGIVSTDWRFVDLKENRLPSVALAWNRAGTPIRFHRMDLLTQYLDGGESTFSYYILEDGRLACASPPGGESLGRAMLEFLISKGL
jgi:hypothetical protein